MARTFYNHTESSDLSSGDLFSDVLTDAQQAANAVELLAPQASTVAGSYFTEPGIPGTDGTSTGTFTLRTNITSSNAGINFRANLMRVNSAGTVQATELGSYLAASVGTRTQTFTDPALGTWAAGDRLRIQYQIENTNAHGGDKGITFETGQLAQDTPFVSDSGPVVVTPTTAALTLATFAPTVTVVDPNQFALDTFTRTIAVDSGWGTADVGGSWTASSNTALGVDGSRGFYTNTGSVSKIVSLGSVSEQDVELVFQFAIADLGGAGENYGFQGLLRFVDSSNFYRSQITVADSGAVSVRAQKTVADSLVSITSDTATGRTYAATEVWTAKFHAEGTSPTTLRIKVWKTSDSEPGTWDLETTDSEAVLQTSAGVGVRFLPSAGTYLTTFTVDDYDAGPIPAAGTVVTPPTAALTLTAFAPTIIAPRTVTPTTPSLSLTTFAPVVTASDRQTVTPTTAALSLTAFAPSVAVTAHQLVTPGVASLSLTPFAPTVSATADVTVTPPTASLTLTAFAPAVTGGAGLTVTPGAASLSLTTFAPDVAVTAHQTVTPTTATLSLTAFAPDVGVGDQQVVVPTTASLSLTAFAPVVTAAADRVVTPPTAALSLTAFAPDVTGGAGLTIVPTAASLALTAFAPTVTAIADQVVTPTPAALSLTAFAPDVVASDHITVTPPTAALVLTTFVPTAVSDIPIVVGGAPPGVGAAIRLMPSAPRASHPTPET
jgi:hypothetical protein